MEDTQHTPEDSYFERLLDQIHPRQSAEELSRRQAQVLCGRWLALRRLRAGLASDTLAAAAGLAAEDLMFLETGLADPELIAAPERQRLAELLGGSADERAPVADIVAAALGEASPDSPIVAWVRRDMVAPADEADDGI